MGKWVIALSLILLLMASMHPLLKGHGPYDSLSLGGSYLALLDSISTHDRFKLEAWESSASWIAAVPKNLTELEK